MPNRSWFKPDPGNTLQQSTYPSNSQHFSTEFLLRPTRAQSLKQFLLTMHLHQINGINGSSCIEGIGMGTSSFYVGDALLISVPVQLENWDMGLSGERSHLQQQVEQDGSVLTWHMTLAAVCCFNFGILRCYGS